MTRSVARTPFFIASLRVSSITSRIALTLVPQLVAIVVTLEICVAIGLQLNFANIIALPFLLVVGVALKIYYVMAWRSGQTNFLQSSLTHAVSFSACTTATAFGSLWFSHHPGTSSMGKLMALSLVTMLSAAVLFQPALLAMRSESHADGQAAVPSHITRRQCGKRVTVAGERLC